MRRRLLMVPSWVMALVMVLAHTALIAHAQDKHEKKDAKDQVEHVKYEVHFNHEKADAFHAALKKKAEKDVSATDKALDKAIHGHQKEFEVPRDQELLDLATRLGLVDHLEQVKDLQPMKWATELGVWTLVIFLGLLYILRKMAWGPMLEGLQKREEHIKGAVEEAKLARAETQRVAAEFKAKMDQAYAEIPKIMEEARRDAEALKEELRTQTTKEIQTERARLRREIDTARDQALAELWNQAAQLATLMSAKVLHKAITPEDHQRLFNLALDEVKGSGERYREEFLKGHAK